MIDWKYAAREKLRDYAAQKNAVENIPAEIAALKSMAESIRSATTDATPVQGGSSTREDMLLSNIQKRGELEKLHERAILNVQTVEAALAVLTDEERLLLERMYIYPQRGKVERIMQELGLDDDSSVYRRVDKAMKHFTIAYYGATES